MLDWIIDWPVEFGMVQWTLVALILLMLVPALLRWFYSDPVVAFDPDDPAMIDATAKAKASIHTFWNEVEDKWSDQNLHALKVAFDIEGGGREHVWLAVQRDSRATSMAVLMNRPQYLSKSEGEAIAFSSEDITDWMIRRESGTLGGFSIRAMLAKVPEKKAREMAQQHGLSYPA